MLTALRTRTARLAASAVVVATVTTGCFAAGGNQPLPAGGLTRQLYDLVNADRAANRRAGFGWDAQLGGLAQEWAQHMGATGAFQHRNLNEVIHRPNYAAFTRLAENILVSPHCHISAAEIEASWMNSPGHRRNILGNYNVIGIGVACVNGRLWAVQNFGLR